MGHITRLTKSESRPSFKRETISEMREARTKRSLEKREKRGVPIKYAARSNEKIGVIRRAHVASLTSLRHEGIWLVIGARGMGENCIFIRPSRSTPRRQRRQRVSTDDTMQITAE
jgi:hypothetical protein